MNSRYSLYLLTGTLALFGCGGGGDKAQQTQTAPEQNIETVQNSVDPATAGAVLGSVKFAGVKPTPQKISMGADAYCKTQHTSPVYSEDVVVNPNGTLKWVYVYVKSGWGDKKFPPPAHPAVFDQKGCTYHPHVLALQAGQEIVVRNSDGVLHNVNARPTKNQGFNFGQPIQGMETKKNFANSEVMIPVKCDVHPWMIAYIGVQNHPYAAVTGDDGSFAFSNLPPGTYEIEVWHEKYGTTAQTVTVGAKETKKLEFVFKGALKTS